MYATEAWQNGGHDYPPYPVISGPRNGSYCEMGGKSFRSENAICGPPFQKRRDGSLWVTLTSRRDGKCSDGNRSKTRARSATAAVAPQR
jgi:hypothetical protein